MLADAGFGDVFVAYPFDASRGKQARLRALHESGLLRLGIDSVEGAQALADATVGCDAPLEVLIEIDPGYGRTGVGPESVALVADAARDAGLLVVGVYAHAGHAYDGPDPEAIARAAGDEERVLATAWAALCEHGHRPVVASAGSTPTALLSSTGAVTEERPGTYVFGDRQLIGLGVMRDDQLTLVVAATVVSTSVPGHFVLDAGAKVLGRDRMLWQEGYGAVVGYPDARIARLDDHHAMVECRGSRPTVGEVVTVVPNSACSAINLAAKTAVRVLRFRPERVKAVLDQRHAGCPLARTCPWLDLPGTDIPVVDRLDGVARPVTSSSSASLRSRDG